ncbi:helix-turn-helix domain-containing protein [Heyndrickxia acidicola]|uniref:Helix-turn-helix transcriptional regulator n=1 Tax=Heyndrickxia acidicola TaxID=209389 RepID=A0ABU6MC32_9BACI|nr:helix-turn-helix transcriptional regulator [Heyndrickxia acidicola]MED1201984.1 helix-turn-helix transcriptional regulator [Heyndrickxia acidicola]
MFGKRLRELRKKKGLTMKEFGNKFSLAESTISGYENGIRKPDIELVDKFADFFEVSSDYLLGRTDSPNPTINSSILNQKDEKDIAKRMEKIKQDLEEANSDGDGLNFYGEPMSQEAMESLLEAMEYAVRQTQRINKKYIPKKYREKNEE